MLRLLRTILLVILYTLRPLVHFIGSRLAVVCLIVGLFRWVVTGWNVAAYEPLIICAILSVVVTSYDLLLLDKTVDRYR